jgi:hypothetical protein
MHNVIVMSPVAAGRRAVLFFFFHEFGSPHKAASPEVGPGSGALEEPEKPRARFLSVWDPEWPLP